MIQWTKDKKDLIFSMREANYSYDSIAEEFNTTRANISRVITNMTREGYSVLKARPWNEQEVERLIQYRIQGKNNKTIAQLLNKSHDSVKKKSSELIKLGSINPITKGYKDTWTNDAILYLVKFDDFHKVGITQRSIERRFAGAPNYIVLDQLSTNLTEALELEQFLLSAVSMYKYIPVNHWLNERGGTTECFIPTHPIQYFEDLC